MNDILTMRTELANDLAVAGAKLLNFTATAGALAAIPETDPQQYVVAGTLESIAAVLPVEPAPARRKDDHRPTEPLSFEDEVVEAVIPAPAEDAHEKRVVAAARKLCDLSSDACGIDRDDNWMIYGEQYKIDARLALEAADAAVPAIARQAQPTDRDAGQWISVDERLPEDCQEVLVLCPDTGCEPAIWSALWLSGSKTFESNSNGWADLDDVSHWMPRPTAPALKSEQKA